MLKYLPLKASQWTVAVPLDSVVEVRILADEMTSNSPDPVGVLPDASLPPTLPALALESLLGGVTAGQVMRYGILLTCRDGMFGLLVAGLNLPQESVTSEAIPLILRSASSLFSGVIAGSTPTLLLDVEQIGRMVHQASMLHEVDHA